MLDFLNFPDYQNENCFKYMCVCVCVSDITVFGQQIKNKP